MLVRVCAAALAGTAAAAAVVVVSRRLRRPASEEPTPHLSPMVAEPSATVAQAPPMSEDLHTVVVVGVTGDGKSSTCNTLAAQSAFAVSDGPASQTAVNSYHDFIGVHAGELTQLRVVDTIGLHDTCLPAAEVMKRFAAFAELVPLGIDAFLFVVRWGRFKPEHEAAFDAFVANCGPAALPHTLLVFTGCTLDDAALMARLEEGAPASLRRLLPCLARPPLGIENLSGASAARAKLLEAISEMAGRAPGSIAEEGGARGGGGRRRFTHAALTAARQRYDARQEAERLAFAAAVADWRKGSGPVQVVHERATGTASS